MATWPSQLQDALNSPGFNMQKSPATIRTQMDSGPPKTRSRYTKSRNQVNGTIWVTFAERDILDEFHDVTLSNGATSFDWVDPIDQVTPKVFRFTAPPSYSPVGPLNLQASIQLEEIPQ